MYGCAVESCDWFDSVYFSQEKGVGLGLGVEGEEGFVGPRFPIMAHATRVSEVVRGGRSEREKREEGRCRFVIGLILFTFRKRRA